MRQDPQDLIEKAVASKRKDKAGLRPLQWMYYTTCQCTNNTLEEESGDGRKFENSSTLMRD